MAAVQLCKVMGIEKQPGANPADEKARIEAALEKLRESAEQAYRKIEEKHGVSLPRPTDGDLRKLLDYGEKVVG